MSVARLLQNIGLGAVAGVVVAAPIWVLCQILIWKDTREIERLRKLRKGSDL